MGEEQEIELFDAYLNTELTQTEKREFELKLQEDSDLKKRFQTHQLMHQQLMQVGMNEFKNELNTFENMHLVQGTATANGTKLLECQMKIVLA